MKEQKFPFFDRKNTVFEQNIELFLLFMVKTNMDGRFSGTLSGFIFALLLTAIYWFIGFNTSIIL